jgi:hypothetical protein
VQDRMVSFAEREVIVDTAGYMEKDETYAA